uniref:Selenoprotein N n=1 Tax=Ornithorhynchus anatinus TaxID=9258 RepID=A0A6I8NC05_ORNAN
WQREGPGSSCQPRPASAAWPRATLVTSLGLGPSSVRWGIETRAPRGARTEAALRSLGPDGLFLFSSLDSDKDMTLSPEEFKPIAEKLIGEKPTEEDEAAEDDPGGETLSVEARFRPLVLESMTKSRDGFLGVSHLALKGLRNWTAPASPLGQFAARHFEAFLPPEDRPELGRPWWIVPSELTVFTGYLSNDRFYPPAPRGREVILHRLLSMFHPRPFVKTRFAPQGAVACLSAISDFYYTVVFRIHAEFQLNEPPDFPFWFSPGQFAGHVVLSRDASHVREFKLFVPNHRSLNVDMEWLYGADQHSNMEVDIGYLPQMELEALGPSVPATIQDESGHTVESRPSSGEPVQFVFEEIEWQRTLSREEAARRLEVAMYPFKKVTYLPFTEAFDRAKAEKKLVHSVLLWGALDDQSCSGRTLRETVLESSPVLALLNESFVSTWSLVKELEELQRHPENEAHRELAARHLEKYGFPVEMLICLANGTVVHHMNANHFLDITSLRPEAGEGAAFGFAAAFEDPAAATYAQFLREGLRRAGPFLQP